MNNNNNKENKAIVIVSTIVLGAIGTIVTIDSEIKHRLWKRSLNEIGKLMEKVSTLKGENKKLKAEIANLKKAEAENKEKDSAE